MSRQEECVQKLTLLIKQGKVKPLETIVEGFDKVAEAFVGLFAGENTGKMLIKVSSMPQLHQRLDVSLPDNAMLRRCWREMEPDLIASMIDKIAPGGRAHRSPQAGEGRGERADGRDITSGSGT